MKYVIFLGDGMADDPQELFDGQTLIEAADTPNMDRIAREGRCGLLETVPDGMQPDSTVANLSVLGYDPHQCLEGRGVLEAAAMGVRLSDTDYAMRVNLVNAQDGLMISHSADNISDAEAHALIKTLNQLQRPGVTFYPGISYRHVLKILEPASKDVECAPPHDHLDEPLGELLPTSTSPDGRATAQLLCDLILESNALLENHPVNLERAAQGKKKANYCWPWSIGQCPNMDKFEDMFGVKGAVVSAVDLIRGIAFYAGMTSPRVKGATGLSDTNYEGKADAALKLLEDHDLVYIHVEASDEAGHEGDAELKCKCIEYLDRRLISRVMQGAPEPTRFAVLPDHYTPVAQRCHLARPVPFAIMGPGIEADSSGAYSEQSCAQGAWSLKGDEFIKALLNH